jgi:hypothetical protein
MNPKRIADRRDDRFRAFAKLEHAGVNHRLSVR